MFGTLSVINFWAYGSIINLNYNIITQTKRLEKILWQKEHVQMVVG